MPGFLPEYPFAANPLLLFGFLLLAGVIGGEVVQRVLAVPQIVGYVLIGLLLGAGGLGVLDTGLVKEAWTFVELALGLILFELGRRLDITWLRRDAWLAATAVLESALTFWLLFLVLTLLGVGPLHAAVAAAIGISTSPAVVLVVAQDLRAEGQVTERALNLAAINSVISFVVVTVLLAAALDAPATHLPQLTRVKARPVVNGRIGQTIVVQSIPVMIVKPEETVAQENRGDAGTEK